MIKRVVLAVSLTANLGLWSARSVSADDVPIDLNDPAQVSAGQERFNHTCAGYCHGRDGLQGKAPSLRGRADLSREQIHSTISNGKRDVGKIMPAWKGQLNEQEIWQITAFILSMQNLH
jgi:mono/diheme cytochrome c family protein